MVFPYDRLLTVNHCVADGAINCVVTFELKSTDAFDAPVLIDAPTAGYTLIVFALELVMYVDIPAVAVGNTTPVPDAAEVITLIDLVNGVASPCVLPVAVIVVPTDLITKLLDVI
jgi:hypothetical protein